MTFPVKTIGVIGAGVVGSAVARTYAESCEIRVYDRVKSRSTHDLISVLESELIFVCLPTPTNRENNGLDTSVLDLFFRVNLPDRLRGANFVVRSTVPVGYTRTAADKFGLTNVVHSPEFLTARCAAVDSLFPVRNLIGIPPLNPNPSGRGYEDNRCAAVYERVLVDRFPGAGYTEMSSDESEAVKLFTNSFYAAKVALFNEFREMSDKLGVDWGVVRAGIIGSGRVGESHTTVPGPDGKFGFGGSCLPPGYTVVREDGIMIPVEALHESVSRGKVRIESVKADGVTPDVKTVKSVSSRRWTGELVVIEAAGRRIECTPDHLLPVLRDGRLKTVRAETVTDTDSVLVDYEIYPKNLSTLR